jgi:adenosylmethionine-8-amino-7-oxononanoate aminotransferase
MGSVLHEKLRAVSTVPNVGFVQGRGLLAGIELVDDGTGAPFPRAAHFAETVTRAALDNGLVVWPNVGHTNGVEGDLVMLAPPFTVTEAEIDAIVSRLVESINAAVAQVASHR